MSQPPKNADSSEPPPYSDKKEPLEDDTPSSNGQRTYSERQRKRVRSARKSRQSLLVQMITSQLQLINEATVDNALGLGIERYMRAMTAYCAQAHIQIELFNRHIHERQYAMAEYQRFSICDDVALIQDVFAELLIEIEASLDGRNKL